MKTPKPKSLAKPKPKPKPKPQVSLGANDSNYRRRDRWIVAMSRSKTGSAVLVGDRGETLQEVYQWLVQSIRDLAAVEAGSDSVEEKE